MTTAEHETAIKNVLDFWFVTASKKWFGPDASQFDKPITEKFGSLVEHARLTDELEKTWTNTASGSLALVLLLDQFTRNIYRPGSHPTPGLSWSGDAKALKIAAESLSKGYDREVQEKYASMTGVGYHHRQFFYLPFMHAEELCSQVACVALFENMAKELELKKIQKKNKGEKWNQDEQDLLEMVDFGVSFAIRHRDCVAKLGRFPARNEPLGRASTEEDKKYLQEHPQGF